MVAILCVCAMLDLKTITLAILILEIVDSRLKCYYGNYDTPNILCRIKPEVMEQIIDGQMSFQRAFMTGDMQVKGDFRILLLLDQVFTFLSAEE